MSSSTRWRPTVAMRLSLTSCSPLADPWFAKRCCALPSRAKVLAASLLPPFSSKDSLALLVPHGSSAPSSPLLFFPSRRSPVASSAPLWPRWPSRVLGPTRSLRLLPVSCPRSPLLFADPPPRLLRSWWPPLSGGPMIPFLLPLSCARPHAAVLVFPGLVSSRLRFLLSSCCVSSTPLPSRIGSLILAPRWPLPPLLSLFPLRCPHRDSPCAALFSLAPAICPPWPAPPWPSWLGVLALQARPETCGNRLFLGRRGRVWRCCCERREVDGRRPERCCGQSWSWYVSRKTPGICCEGC